MATRPRPISVAIVPHTHWDREWYAPFQTFRLRLVELMDRLLPMLEQDLSYARFLLDGQTAVLDDYLAVRPQARPALHRLAAAGRLSVGPWAVLMDEFMVSGETLVRDLQMGIARATELGGPMEVGYLPDMFGHVAQMPQILRAAGLEHAVVWRGVPSAVTKTAFWWEAPDGSRVRAEYLYGSYSNGRDIPDDAKQLVARARGYELELGDALLPGGSMLLMNGTDHQLPQPWLGRVVAEANEIQDDYRFAVTSLAEYVATQPVDGLDVWRGELRSGARANVLMGVASNRVDVHQACAAAERALERRAEPSSALFLPPEAYPGALLDLAWRNLVLNSAHDSSCACSADEVVDQVLVRYHEARQIGDGLTSAAVHALARSVDAPAGATVVVNPTSRARGGLVAARVPGDARTEPVHFVSSDGVPVPVQVVDVSAGEGFSATVTGEKVRWVLEMMRGTEFAGAGIASYDVSDLDDGTVEVVFQSALPGGSTVDDLESLRDHVLALGTAGRTVRFRAMRPSTSGVLFAADDVPGFGWRTYQVAPGAGPSTVLRAAGRDLANEHLRVRVDDDGTFTISTAEGVVVEGCNRYVDGGDGGDTYNWSPPERDLVVERPDAVAVSVAEDGPVRAALLVRATYRWPVACVGDERACVARSDETETVVVDTRLEVRIGERFVRVHTELDNRCRDHRLRAHFPLPAPVERSSAECAFAVVERGLTSEGGPHEVALPTFVSRRFVDASDGEVGVALLHDGLLEYELVDGRELALTLLRATGYLSRSQIVMRPNPAGPLDPLDGPQLQRRLRFDYAVAPHAGTWHDADLYALADELLVPLERARATGTGTRATSGRALAVDGAEVSAVLREPGGLAVRCFNPSAETVVATVEHDGAPARGWRVDLRGRPVDRFEGSVELRGCELATLRLD
ncbi:MAG TPA: glycoside hydrolase family 38 C-terminal domain-containing protein [Acidimicrobiia bacterium]|nr:glycoside hydrolase family 38 C-terminal domain-containing protein [Acidimicrobiia bacterium]